MPCPALCPADRWREVVADAGRFLDRWGAQAHRHGWTALDMFGVDPVRPWDRYDARGLVPAMRGCDLVALTAAGAGIRHASGNVLTHYRHQRRRSTVRVALWELA